MGYGSLPQYDSDPHATDAPRLLQGGGTVLQAFAAGGCGCLLAFAGCAGLAVAVGGRAWIDPGGACCLFVVGGLVGLAIRAVYRWGWRAGRSPDVGHTVDK